MNLLATTQAKEPISTATPTPTPSLASTHAIKKPINIDAQSFIPKNLKKPSISSEKEILSQIQQPVTPKKEVLSPKKEVTAEKLQTESKESEAEKVEVDLKANDEAAVANPEITRLTENKEETSKATEKVANENDKPKEKETREESTSTSSVVIQKTSSVTSAVEESKENKNQAPIKQATEDKEKSAASETKPTVAPTAPKKPSSALGSILSQPPSTATKKTEATVVITSHTSQNKKKGNDINRALEEKAKLIKEQEKIKKEEKLKQEIQQKNAAASASAANSTKEKKSESKKTQPEAKEPEVPKPAEKKEAEISPESKESENALYKDDEEEDQQIEAVTPKQEEVIENKFTIEKHYFKVYENEPADKGPNRYSFDYLFTFKNWKICNETKLIEDLISGHFKELRETCEEVSTQKHQGNRNDNKNFGKRGTKFRDEPLEKPKISNENMTFQRNKIDLKPPEPKEIVPVVSEAQGLGKWGRKDLSNEEKIAADFKSRREEEVKKDPIRFKLTEYINNYLFIFFIFTLILYIIHIQKNKQKIICVIIANIKN